MQLGMICDQHGGAVGVTAVVLSTGCWDMVGRAGVLVLKPGDACGRRAAWSPLAAETPTLGPSSAGWPAGRDDLRRKKAAVAVAHKLLVIAYALMR